MGYLRRWNSDVLNQVSMMRSELLSVYTDSYVAWGCKQELYKIKWLIDKTLQESSTYSGEEEWLKEQQQKEIIEILRK